MTEAANAVTRLTRDLRNASATLSVDEARFLVDSYYMMQEDRKRSNNQVRTLSENAEPHLVLSWFADQAETMEKQILRALSAYALSRPTGAWAMGVFGIGPVIAAGLLAHIDITKAPTVGHIWRFAGLDSTVIWETKEATTARLKELVRAYAPLAEGGDVGTNDVPIDEVIVLAASHFGRKAETLRRIMGDDLTLPSLVKALQRRPWNAQLKTLCWKIGESFVKVKSSDKDFYGHLYDQRKVYEHEKNEKGDYAELAKKKLQQCPGHAQRAIYATGKLPPGHIHSRAKRYVVKLFLAHFHEVLYKEHFKAAPPLPYAIAYLGHAHKIEPPVLSP